MPTKRKKERIVGRFFVWLLGQRNGVYVADGRSNRQPLGRHSLGTRDYQQALTELQRLDLVQAVTHGLADKHLLDGNRTAVLLSLEDGRRLYDAHVGRPRVTGGAKPATPKRYRAVFDKFLPFARGKGVTTWNGVSGALLHAYAAWLDDEGYAYRTEYLELTCIKQALKWLVEHGHLPAVCLVRLPLRKPTGTDTYCWRPEEVAAIMAYCRARPVLTWLANVVVALACTGLRISELAALRWADIDFQKNVIVLTDESTQARRPGGRPAREIKNRRSRSFPIHEDLARVLRGLPRRGDGLVFQGPRSGVLKPDTVRAILVRDVLRPLAERFPTPEGETGFRDGRLHSFRHFFCSTCANCGVPEQVVMHWLGHRQSAMVRHYYHLHDDEAQRQMKRLTFVNDVGGADAAR
jgi:integrase